MGSFLSTLASLITGDIKSVVNWITKALSAVYSYLDREFTAAWNEAVGAYHYAVQLYDSAVAFTQSVLTFANYIVNVVIRNLTQWASDAISAVTKFTQGVYTWAAGEIASLIRKIETGLNDITQWVIKSIWDPLYKDISGALKWISKQGAFAYNLLTHPELLAKLLAEYIWASWTDLLKKYGRSIARWLIADLRHLAGPLVDVLEEIISAML